MKYKNFLFELLLLLFSVGIPFMLDTSETVGGMLASFLILLSLRYLNYWLFFAFFSLILLTCTILFPISWWFGEPTNIMIGTFLETDLQEAKEFLQSLPTYSYIISLMILIWGIFILYLGRKKKIVHNRKNNLIFIAISLICLILTIERPIRKIKQFNKFGLEYSHTLVVSYYFSLYNEIMEYRAFQQKLNINLDKAPSWAITSVNPKYDNYVLVVGESVRRDYMSLYGFPEENSTFLKNVKGTVLEGFTSPAANTTASLLRMFTQIKNDNFLYENNLISLANAAGYDTYWLSNQGSISEYDTPLFKIGSLSNHKKFTKKGGYESKKVYDSALLPIFKQYLLGERTSRPRLFIIHLLGSHPLFHNRLEQPVHYNYYNDNISAYIQTIEQTDRFLNTLYTILQADKKSFSIIYFSDHGLTTKDKGTADATLAHGADAKSGYRVPFIQINSNDVAHKNIKCNKSGFNFLDGYAQWLGIKEKSLKNNYSFLSTTPDTLRVFSEESFDSLKEDDIIAN